MASIFYEHVQGEERESLIEEKELQYEIENLNLMYEMVCFQEEMHEKQIELKVLKESGTYEDYAYMLSEAQQETEANKKNILQRIFEWFAKMFTNLANKFSATKQAVAGKDPNTQVTVPQDYIMSAQEEQQLGAAADAMTKINSVGNIAKVAVAGSVIAAIGGLVIYNKKKEERSASPAQATTIGQLAQQIPGLEALQGKLQAAYNKLKSIFEKEPATPTAKEQQQQEINTQNTMATHGAAPLNQKTTVNAQNKPDVTVYHSAPTEDIGSDSYMQEAGVTNMIVDVVKEVTKDPKVLLKYLQMALNFISEKLDVIRTVAGAVASNVTGAAQNAAQTVVNGVRTAQGAVQTAAGLNRTAQTIVNASADTEDIKPDEITAYESVFGEKYVEESDEDKIVKQFNTIFEGI